MNHRINGKILNYRLGKKKQYPKKCLIKVLNHNPSESGQLIGCKVGWPEDNPVIYGKIVSVHGRKGTLKAAFQKGLPGQALGTRVKIEKR